MNRNVDETQRRHGVNYRETLLGSVILVGLLLMAGPAIAKPSMAALDPQLEKAILAQDWEKVIRLLPKEAEPNLPVSLRLIKGHADLATNRNNESHCLFLRVRSERELQEWREWTEAFLRRHPGHAIALYLRGDSWARLRRWEEARACFQQGFRSDPNQALLRNAHGVVCAITQRYDEALEDLCRAAAAEPRLADAYANLGALAIAQREGATGAVTDLDQALAVSKDGVNFALALYSLGCVESVLGRYEKSSEHMAAAGRFGCLRDAIRDQVLKTVARNEAELEKIRRAIAKGEDPQMRIDTDLRRIRESGPGGIGGPLNDMANTLAASKDSPTYTQLKERAFSGLTDVMKNDLSKQAPIMKQWDNIKGTNSPLQSLTKSLFTPQRETNIDTSKYSLGQTGKIDVGIDGIGVGAQGSQGFERTRTRIQEGLPGTSLPRQWMDNSISKINIAEQFNQYQKQVGVNALSKPEGFKTAPEEAAWDRGQWSLDPAYGLYYTAAESGAVSSVSIREVQK